MTLHVGVTCRIAYSTYFLLSLSSWKTFCSAQRTADITSTCRITLKRALGQDLRKPLLQIMNTYRTHTKKTTNTYQHIHKVSKYAQDIQNRCKIHAKFQAAARQRRPRPAGPEARARPTRILYIFWFGNFAQICTDLFTLGFSRFVQICIDLYILMYTCVSCTDL